MIKFTTPIFLLAVLCGCWKKAETIVEGPMNTTIRDTIIGSKPVHTELAGAAYRKRATAYFVVTGRDTSDLTCTFSQSTKYGRIVVDVRFQKRMTYRQQWHELEMI